MDKAPAFNPPTRGEAGPPAVRRARPLVAALAALAGAWTAAGSVGLLAHPLRHALVVLAVMAIIAAAWPAGAAWRRVLLLLAGGGLALAMSAAAMPVVTVLAVAVAADVAAAAAEGPARRLLSAVAAAVFAFAAYRLAVTAVPDVWLAADWVGGAMGRLAGGIAGRPLCVGATFGGVDFLVLMAAAYAAWLAAAPRPRWARAALGAAAILAANVLYLAVLAFAPAMEAAVELLPAPAPDAGVVSAPPWSWRAALGTLVPWNLPALGAAVELLVAGWMFRRTLGEGGGAPVPAPPAGRASAGLAAAAAVLAAAAGAAAVLPSGRCDLHGKKIVIYEKGFLNWLRPVHGEYGRMSAGMYGMLPDFLESLGAGCAVSPDLSEADLRGADAVVLLYPNEPWAAGQLERLGDFVRGGGTLLVMGEHTVREADGGCRFNDALGPTALRVRFDSATFAVGGWLASYEALLHPATAGLTDERNAFGVVIGASVDAPRPARPILVGRWGWADPGDPSAGESMMGNHRYDAGERLGDLVLAAEERLGAGKVIAFGDTSSLTNGITVGAHPFTSRLLAYAAERSAGPAPPWRDALVLVLAAALAAVVAWRPQPGRVVLAAAALAMAVLLSTDAAARAAEVLPDGRGRTPNNLAYIDTTHLEAAGEESWRPDGMMGLAMTLMREGCLVLNLREFTAERLVLAGLVVSVAPSRAFTLAERRAVREFIEAGGIFILTVGCDDAGPSSELLADLGFRIGEPSGAAGAAPARDPEPLGHFKWPYLGAGEGAAHVRFHSAWPVSCGDAEARVIARGADDLPVIVMRRVGRGKAVVIGDTCFAMNKNLENESGDPIEGMRENADFWRWFLRILRDQEAAP